MLTPKVQELYRRSLNILSRESPPARPYTYSQLEEISDLLRTLEQEGYRGRTEQIQELNHRLHDSYVPMHKEDFAPPLPEFCNKLKTWALEQASSKSIYEIMLVVYDWPEYEKLSAFDKNRVPVWLGNAIESYVRNHEEEVKNFLAGSPNDF